ncbi:threonine/serine dehydratase [Paludibacterium purpuratum]|uniref:L-threonine ammonia-lyase n=1 Tax=Paludibacterium purpuratum TaxID=1144873 RepID=A0A4R7B1C2_9NEIS|nr:threonine/serine dehydratase [Paludibacterium purpuratum]TDR73078.1 L-threonine ammonia-lyase [Paludibacterium purpuratum]
MKRLFDHIVEAHQAIRPQVRVTPLDHSPALSALTGCEVYLKCEHLQATGSFKFRGASNKLAVLDDAAKQKGVITASSGNHGQAVALAGQKLGVAVTVYAPETASATKLDAIRAYGSAVVLVKGDALQAEILGRQHAEAQGKTFISPYNDLDVIAGQGTTALEMFEQCPDLDAVFVAVGGGGLISGVGTAFKQLSPATQVIGCWPANATSLYACLQAGKIIEVYETDTISDGTAGGVEPGAVTFDICQQVIDQTVLVPEDDIKAAMKLLAQTDRWMVEGAAGVALGGMLQTAARFKGKKVGVVLCGRNIVLSKFIGAVQ